MLGGATPGTSKFNILGYTYSDCDSLESVLASKLIQGGKRKKEERKVKLKTCKPGGSLIKGQEKNLREKKCPAQEVQYWMAACTMFPLVGVGIRGAHVGEQPLNMPFSSVSHFTSLRACLKLWNKDIKRNTTEFTFPRSFYRCLLTNLLLLLLLLNTVAVP